VLKLEIELMALLYYDEFFLKHDTGHHPERAVRLSSIAQRLADEGLDARCGRPNWDRVSAERLGRVHSLEYVEILQTFASQGGGQIEADTLVSRDSYDVAKRAAGAVCDAVQRVIGGEDSRALCLVRPPGHHALNDAPMGFCLFNNIAIAALVATKELDLDRVLIVDWDVHHGNGTQDSFWKNPQVGFFSVHRFPFYPGTGATNETGSGEGLGTTFNLPVEFGTSRDDYLTQVAHGLEDFAKRLKPQLILVSAGFDSHRLDPVGSLGLEVEDFATLTRLVLDIAASYCDGRVVSALEGGYNPEVVAESVAVHLRELLDYECVDNQ